MLWCVDINTAIFVPPHDVKLSMQFRILKKQKDTCYGNRQIPTRMQIKLIHPNFPLIFKSDMGAKLMEVEFRKLYQLAFYGYKSNSLEAFNHGT